jgi:hypothetical protein
MEMRSPVPENQAQLRLVSIEEDEVAPEAKAPRPRNVVWDEMEAIFGTVPAGTSAFGKRTRAVKDLKLMEATPDELRRAVASFNAAFPGAHCTDMALAVHFPLFRPKAIQKPCDECGTGGGMHSADCPQA